MALPGFANLAVDRLRGIVSATDSHGNQTVDWSNPSVLTIQRCWIGSVSGFGDPGREVLEDRQTTITDQVWWGPEDADVVSTDRLKDTASGVIYEINGPVVLQRSATGALDHKAARLQVISE